MKRTRTQAERLPGIVCYHAIKIKLNLPTRTRDRECHFQVKPLKWIISQPCCHVIFFKYMSNMPYNLNVSNVHLINIQYLINGASKRSPTSALAFQSARYASAIPYI